MRRVLFLVAAIGVLGIAAVVKAHEGHKNAKAGASAPTTKKAATTARPKASLSAPSVEKVSLTGEFIDTQCWFTHNGEGKDHAACAIKCAKGGQDLAFLDTSTGEVHSLIASGHGNDPNDGLYEHVGVSVKVRGTLYKRGVNSGLLLEKIEHAK